jgi:hypothetical protein
MRQVNIDGNTQKGDTLQSPHKMRSQGYCAQRRLATPKWSDPKLTAAVYRERDRLNMLGQDVQVDHIIPLRHPLVCGLHWHHNLAVIGRLGNLLKSNHSWPDKAGELLDLFPETLVPELDLVAPSGYVGARFHVKQET